METVFGVPTFWIAAALGGCWLLAALGLLWLALRNPVLARLGLRQVPRRRLQTLLVTLGLMLSTTIVTTAFGTGDTMSHAIRTVVTASLGRTDEVIVPGQTVGWGEGRRAAQALGRGDALAASSRGSFPLSEYERVAARVKDEPSIAGLAPAVVELRTVVDADSRQTAPDVKLLAVPADYDPVFGGITGPSGPLSLGQLRPGEAYLNKEAADALGAGPGHRLELPEDGYGLAPEPRRLLVREVVNARGLAGTQAAILVPLEHLWETDPEWGSGPSINMALVANAGDSETSVDISREATRALRAAIADRDVAAELYGVMSAPEFRQRLARFTESHAQGAMHEEERGLLLDLSRELERGEPTDEFASLLGDPEMLAELGHMANEEWELDTIWAAARLLPSLHPLGVRETKRQGLEQANLAGNMVTSVFLVLGLFSIAVGVMLVFLIFVMLAAERRAEMGTARALGVKRRHLVQMYLFEGASYSLLASAAGVLAGILVGRVAVGLMGSILEQYGLRLVPYFAPRSLLLAFTLGGLLTFAVVGLSAWRVSHLSIVAAIRDLPDNAPRMGRPRGLLRRNLSALVSGPARAALLLLAGTALLRLGTRLDQAGILGLGASALIIGMALAARWLLARLGAAWADRASFTVAGLALAAYWSRPPEGGLSFATLGGEMEGFVLAGVLMVLGAVWVTVYNLDILLSGIEVGLRRFPRAAAVLRTALAYPRHARFRTGMVLTMFALVIFTMTVGSVLTRSTAAAYTDTEAITGGWSLSATSGEEIPNIVRALESASAVRPVDFAAAGSVARLDVESLRLDLPVAWWKPSGVTVVDEGWLRGAEYPLVARSSEFGSDAEMWRALAEQPGLALAVPDSGSDTGGFDRNTPLPADVWLRDPEGGPPQRLRVVGLLDPRADLGEGLLTRDVNVRRAFTPFEWDSYALKVAPGGDARKAAMGLEISFQEQRLNVDLSGESALRREAIRILLNYLLTGFMALGLLVGIAALGVIATRAVVERRRHIATMRAVGYPARWVQYGLMLEASIVAALGILIGVLLGLVVARNVIAYFATSYPEILYVVPWRQVLVLSLGTWAAVLLMTAAPAWQATRVRPAEGLRTE